jgi:hypothetical protein
MVTVCILAAPACSSDAGDTTSASTPTEAAPPETAPGTAAPTTAPPVITEPEVEDPPVTTTAASESTLPPAGETIEVPFYLVDTGYPAGWTCADAIPGFNVSFSDESGESIVVEARFESEFVDDEAVNTTCAVDLIDQPAIFYAAILEVPAAETYESIEVRYPFANGAGSDRYDPVFQTVTREQLEAGLGVRAGDGTQTPLDAAEVENFPLSN